MRKEFCEKDGIDIIFITIFLTMLRRLNIF